MANVNIDFRVSGKFNELIKKLHAKYPHTERSGIARIVKRPWYYELIDIKFPEQSNHWAETEMTKEWIDKIIEDVLMTEPDNMEERKCWLHSHHRMGCFWSGTDAAAKAQFDDWNTKFWFSVVTAYKASTDEVDYKCALNIFKPIKLEIDIPVTIWDYTTEDIIAEVGKDRYDSVQIAIEEITTDRDQKIGAIVVDDNHSDRYIEEVLDILNAEDNTENRVVVESLIKEQTNEIVDNLKSSYEKDAQYKIDMLLESLGTTYVTTKMTELENNIKKTTFWAIWDNFDTYWSNYTKKNKKLNKAEKKKQKKEMAYWKRFFQDSEDDPVTKRWNDVYQEFEYRIPRLWCWASLPEEEVDAETEDVDNPFE